MANFAIQLGIGLAFSLIGALLKPPTEGPRLKSRKVPRSDYGADLSRIRGMYPVSGVLFWGPRKYEEEKRTSGKVGAKTVRYIYRGSFAYALGAGPIKGVNALRLNGESKIDFFSDKPKIIKRSQEFLDSFQLYKASETQTPNSVMQSQDGVNSVPAYRDLSYIFFEDLDLTDYGNRPPTVEGIAVTKGTQLGADFLEGNYKPITWQTATPSDTTINNAPDDGLLGGSSTARQTGSDAGAHSTETFLRDKPSEVEFLVNGTGKFGIDTSIPSGSYAGLAPKYGFVLGTSLTIVENGTTVWTQAYSYPDGVRLQIKNQNDAALWTPGSLGVPLQYWVNGTLVYTSGATLAASTYYPVAQILTGRVVGNIFTSQTFAAQRIIPDPVLVKDLIKEICQIGGLTLSQIDVSDIPDTTVVLGLELEPGGSPKAWLQQLQQLYFFDVFQRGNGLIFKQPIKGASVRTLTLDDLASAELDTSRPPRFELKSPNPSELPGEVSLKYLDVLDPSMREKTVYARAETNPSRDKMSLSCSAALTLTQAQAICNTWLNLKWYQRTVSFKLTLDHCDLEPGDVITVPVHGSNQRVMLTRVTLGANFLLECEGQVCDDHLYNLVDPEYAPLPTDLAGKFDRNYIALMDIPSIKNTDPSPNFYWGVGGDGAEWRTAYLNVSVDGDDWTTIDRINDESTLGVANIQLPSATGLDTTNTLIVSMASGILSTITNATFAAGGLTNLLLVGDEILRFRDATLIGEKTYSLSHLSRGLKSTATTGHQIGERVALLSTVNLVSIEPDLVGVPLEVRVTFDGEGLDSAVSIPFTAN